ncbi:GMC family oxidoreductase [Microbacterium sp. B2969]|uniref:GMC family oxidoreductase n=1 Tax=Microbacterium alkaliflavum TaxID=3248839 RepID=A0ABW7Q3D5_9MICO
MRTETFDFVVVGSGAAGSVLAHRLSEGGRHSVLVIESGSSDRNPLHRVPKGFFFTLRGTRYSHHYPTEPIEGTDTRELWIRGNVVGGSTTVNGLMYLRGSKADYDLLEARTGSPRWGWVGFLAAYRAMEDHALGGSPLRGAGGELPVSIRGADDELTRRVCASAAELGWGFVDDVNAHDAERIGFAPETSRHGVRASAASAFLRPALRRTNVSLVTDTTATRIVLRRGRAVAVHGMQRGAPVEFAARREVIVAAGTVESALLLERSGVGRADVLHGIGVDLAVESPNVGERVIEHHGAANVQVALTKRLGATERLNTVLKQGASGAGYVLSRRGPVSTGFADFAFLSKSDPGLDRPDLMGTISSIAIDPGAPRLEPASHSGISISMWQIRPDTTSSVHATSAHPARPIVRPRYFETDRDRRAAGNALAVARRLLAQTPLAEVSGGEDFPTKAVASDPAAAIDYARRHGSTIYHAVGSCAMGPGDADVVDADLRVRGVDGLRVVDASVLPLHVSGNTAAPVMALAWIAGGMIADSA